MISVLVSMILFLFTSTHVSAAEYCACPCGVLCSECTGSPQQCWQESYEDLPIIATTIICTGGYDIYGDCLLYGPVYTYTTYYYTQCSEGTPSQCTNDPPNTMNDPCLGTCTGGETGPGDPGDPGDPPSCIPTAPSAPTLLLPANEHASSLTTFPLSWEAPVLWNDCGVKKYRVCVGSNQTNVSSVNLAALGWESSCDMMAYTTADSSVLTTSLTVPLNAGTYYWKVAAYNGIFATSSTVRSLYAPGEVRVNVVEALNCSTTTFGSLAGFPATSVSLSDGMSSISPLSLSTGNPATALFTPLRSHTAYSVVPLSLSAPWIQTCAATPLITAGGFNTSPMITTVRVSQMADPWWQVMGGDAYAAGSISTRVPSTAAAPASALAHIGATTSSSGVMIAGGTVGVTGALGPAGRDWSVPVSSYQTTTRENYGYFVRLLELGTLTAGNDSFGGSTSMNAFPPLANAVKQFPSPDDNVVYYRDGNLQITGLAVAATEKRTLIVNGDVTVSGNISVSGGGFFQVISSGDITFEGSVTNAQGIYVANGTLTVADAGDGAVGFAARRFLGQGVFVGWGGVSLQRDLNGSTAADDLENNLNAAERFTYRADLIINAPPSLMRSGIQWQEVVPQPNGLSATPTPAPTPTPTPTPMLCSGFPPVCPNSVCCTNGSWTCCAGGDSGNEF